MIYSEFKSVGLNTLTNVAQVYSLEIHSQSADIGQL